MSDANIDFSFLNQREGDFQNILAVLNKTAPERPTLFEFFHNADLYRTVCDAAGIDMDKWRSIPVGNMKHWRGANAGDDFVNLRTPAFIAMGYDYVTMHASDIFFDRPERDSEKSCSMSHGGVITDRASFKAYTWPDVQAHGLNIIENLAPHLPDGMQFIAFGPGGVLENLIALAGYEELCFMLIDDPELVEQIANCIGQTLLDYYTLALQHERVGAIISNDDWGFSTQTMLSTADMRRLIFPWHKKIVAAAHAAGKPAILHSCGNLADVYEDIIEEMRFDGKHSYEDKIQPVEEAYEMLKGRLAVLGGMDVDFVCRRPGEAIYNRAKALLEQTSRDGGYGLGTGNSVPDYVPMDNFFQILRACVE